MSVARHDRDRLERIEALLPLIRRELAWAGALGYSSGSSSHEGGRSPNRDSDPTGAVVIDKRKRRIRRALADAERTLEQVYGRLVSSMGGEPTSRRTTDPRFVGMMEHGEYERLLRAQERRDARGEAIG